MRRGLSQPSLALIWLLMVTSGDTWESLGLGGGRGGKGQNTREGNSNTNAHRAVVVVFQDEGCLATGRADPGG